MSKSIHSALNLGFSVLIWLGAVARAEKQTKKVTEKEEAAEDLWMILPKKAIEILCRQSNVECYIMYLYISIV